MAAKKGQRRQAGSTAIGEWAQTTTSDRRGCCCTSERPAPPPFLPLPASLCLSKLNCIPLSLPPIPSQLLLRGRISFCHNLLVRTLILRLRQVRHPVFVRRFTSFLCRPPDNSLLGSPGS